MISTQQHSPKRAETSYCVLLTMTADHTGGPLPTSTAIGEESVKL